MTEEQKKVIEHVENIEQLARKKGNYWLLLELKRRFASTEKIDAIYEYCIERVIHDQAKHFYEYFPITELIDQLVVDYCRMEKYRRQNNFEDFCLAVYQQVENITNWFCKRPKFIDLYKSKKNSKHCFKDKNGNPSYKDTKGNVETIGQVIITSDYSKRKDLELMKLYFNERIRAVLYFVYFNEKTTKYVFDTKYNELNELYQCRNLNHRGAIQSSFQNDIIEKIKPHKYNYYLKFTGLLVDFVECIGEFMAKKEENGIVTNVLPSAIFVKILENNDVFPISNGKFWNKLKDIIKKDDRVRIYRNKVTNEILDIVIVK